VPARLEPHILVEHVFAVEYHGFQAVGHQFE
jgi:hypothetical protein